MITARLNPARTMSTSTRRTMTARRGRQWIRCVACGWSAMSPSAALEGGLALLDEGPGPLAHVLGGAAQPEERGLHRKPLVQGGLQAFVHRLEGVAQRHRAAGQDR